MARRSGFGLTKPAKIGLFAGLIVLVIIGISMMMIPTSAPPQESIPAPTASGTALGTALGTAVPLGTALGTASGTVVTYTYPANTGKIGSNRGYNCPGATGVDKTGAWCMFANEKDAQNYCNDPKNDCAGYSVQPGKSYYQVISNKELSPAANAGWTWYPKTTS